MPETLVIDVDGTICFDGRSVAPQLLDKLVSISDEHTIVFASARHPRDVRRLLPAPLIDRSYIVGGNGAIGVLGTDVLFTSTYNAGVANALLKLLIDSGCAFLIDKVWNFSKSSVWHPLHDLISSFESCIEDDVSSALGDDVIKFLALPNGQSQSNALSQVFAAVEGLHFHPHSDGSVDITAAAVNKFEGLARAIELPDSFICFGNDTNDVPLFSKAKFSVQIGAHPALQKLAHRHIQPPAMNELMFLSDFLDVLDEIAQGNASTHPIENRFSML